MKSPKIGSIQEFQLSSEPSSVGEVERIIEQYNTKLKFKDDVFGNIMVAVTEAVNNAIVHGNKADPEKKINVTFDLVKPFHFVVKVRDEGAGFDTENLPDPTSPENIEKEGGRGIFLIKMLSDNLLFHKGGKEIVMTFLV